jgi:hypothetical protein
LEITWSTLMWYSLVGLLPLLVTIWRPRLLGARATARTADRAGSSRRHQTTAILVIAGALVLGCCCGGLDNVFFASEVPAPSSFELFPLPTGMQGTVAAGPDGETGCDNAAHSCWMNFRITGRPAESTFDLTTRIRQHLQEAKGWDGQWPCRPVHWFAQQAPTDFCINMTDDPASTPDRRPTIDVELIISNLTPPSWVGGGDQYANPGDASHLLQPHLLARASS